MRGTFRLVCADCLRSAEAPPRADDADAAPRVCAHCGGPIEIHWEDGSDEYSTPLSLALTPEETPAWFEADPVRFELDPARGPEQIGRFQLRESLGGGGFGQVFRAYDPRLDRDIALKVLREGHPTARVMERFFREARAAAQLDHPNIVSLHDAGRDDGRCWIAYQFVEGRTLGRVRTEGGAMDPWTATRIVRDLADALDHAHRRGVLHRDVKPANVIVDPQGRARLTDFGLARRLDLDATMTVEGTILGTPAYMSPEQASGRSHTADARSDVYSLGVLYYELLSGRRPCDLPSDIPAWRAELRGPLPPLDRAGGRVPRPLERICRRTLAEDPAHRYPDARGLADDLDAWLNRPTSRWSWPLGLAIALGFGLSLGLGWSWLRNDPTAPVSTRTDGNAIDRATPRAGVGGSAPIRIVIAPEPASGAEVFAGPGTRIFHRPTCAALRRVAPEQRVRFPDAAAARRESFVACALCRPGGGEAESAD